MEEQILHQIGYKVWEIPRLTGLERRRLVRGFMLYKSPEEDTPEEKMAKSEELIRKRRAWQSRTSR